MSDLSTILHAMQQGDRHAADQLLPLVYDELRKLAAQKLAHEAPGQTLQPTALVHEAYLRLAGTDDEPHWEGRGHFFAAAAESMRRILIENARRKASGKRGGGRHRQGLDLSFAATPVAEDDWLDLDEALTKLNGLEPQIARLVELRFFTGLTIKEAADLLDISPRTADSWWAYARAWLIAELQGPAE